MVDWTVPAFFLPAYFRLTRLVKHSHQAEMMQGTFALVLLARDCAKVQVVRRMVIEQVARAVHLAASSRREATADQLNHERQSLLARDCAKVRVVKRVVIE
jgi:hypothetical protein